MHNPKSILTYVYSLCVPSHFRAYYYYRMTQYSEKNHPIIIILIYKNPTRLAHLLTNFEQLPQKPHPPRPSAYQF